MEPGTANVEVSHFIMENILENHGIYVTSGTPTSIVKYIALMKTYKEHFRAKQECLKKAEKCLRSTPLYKFHDACLDDVKMFYTRFKEHSTDEMYRKIKPLRITSVKPFLALILCDESMQIIFVHVYV